MTINNDLNKKKEFERTLSKADILKWTVAAAAIAASGALAACCFLGVEGATSNQNVAELPEEGSLVPLAQDVALFAGGVFHSLVPLAAAAYVGKEQQPDLVKDEHELKEEANLFLHSIEESWDYVDTCPLNKMNPLWGTNSQSSSIAVHEGNLKHIMNKRRSGLRLGSENAIQFGNKHSNLEQIAHLDAALDLEGLEIPLPKGISSESVVIFLQRTKPEIFERWEILRKLYSSHQGSEPFLQTKAAKDHLQIIHELIREAFSKNRDLAAIGASVQWLEEREKAGDFLMIRSTGAEDSKKSANAGGNLSRAYVRPTPEEFMEAAGSVVASYFGEQSLQNRIDSQINPFEEPLQLAVTMQKLIGEPVGGAKKSADIPVSFVVFTNEPLFVGEEQFRVMRISASYGHGEAVVGNKGIATDTVFLLQSLSEPEKLYTLYQNQKKLRRLAPVEKEGKISLQKMNNPKHLVKQRALSERMLMQIYRSALVMESFYEEHPTDIEGVVQNGIVYFVQARPINRKPMLPTFLRDKEGSVDQVQAEILVPAEASVLAIRKEEDILFAPTLEIAEQLSAQRGRGSYRLIVVAQPDPANSHFVVNFSSLGIPCLWTSDQQAVQDLIQKIDQDHLVVVCMQTGSIHLWDNKKVPFEKSVEKGFGVHPAEIAVSLPVAEITSAKLKSSQELKDLLIGMRSVSSSEEALLLLEKISHFTKPLKQEIFRFEKVLAAGNFSPEAYQKFQLLQALEDHIEKALKEARKHYQNFEKNRLRGLFLLKTLESLLLHPFNPAVVGKYSLAQASSIIESIDLLIRHQEGLSRPALLGKELLAGFEAVLPEAFDYWSLLLKKLEIELQEGRISKVEINTFRGIIGRLTEARVLSQWIYLLPQDKSPIEQFQTILQQFPEAQLTSMRDLQELQEKVEEQHLTVDRFSSPETYEEAWEELTELVSIVSSIEWLDKVEKMSPTNRMIAYRTMEKVLTLLDDSHKKVKVGNFGNEKGKLFKKMLKVFYTLTRNWNQMTRPISTYREGGIVERSIDGVGETLEDLDDNHPEALLPSNKFSVQAAITAHVFPETLEDMLTLLHQMSIRSIYSLNLNLMPPEYLESSLLPLDFKQALKDIELTAPLGSRSVFVIRTGIDISEEVLVARYNVPLKNHSGQIDLIYDTRSSKLTMKASFLGPAEHRWMISAQVVRILENMEVLRLATPLVCKQTELRFSWEITNRETLAFAMREYVEIAKLSIHRDQKKYLKSFFLRWSNTPRVVLGAIQEANAMVDHKMDLEVEVWGVGLFAGLIESGYAHVEAIEAAERVLKSNSILPALKLYKTLVRANQGYPQAVIAAQKGLLSSDSVIQGVGLELFHDLVQQNQGFSEAVIAAQKALLSSESWIQAAGLGLFEDLVQQNQGFSEAVIAAQKALLSSESWIQGKGLKLFENLVQRNQGFSEALMAAEKALLSSNSRIQIGAIELYKKLVKQNKGLDEALNAIEKFSIDSKEFDLLPASIRDEIINLCVALFRSNLEPYQALTLAEKALLSISSPLRKEALKFYSTLFIRNQGYSEARSAGQKALLTGFSDIQETGLELYEKLVEKNQGLPEALSMIKRAPFNLNSDFKNQVKRLNLNSDFKNQVKRLYLALFKADLKPDQALIIAESALFSSDSLLREEALNLYKTLFKRNQGYSEALEVAKKALYRENPEVQKAGKDLCNVLLSDFPEKLSYLERLNIGWLLL